MKRKLLMLFLALTIALTLAACGGTVDENGPDRTEEPGVTEPQPGSSELPEAPEAPEALPADPEVPAAPDTLPTDGREPEAPKPAEKPGGGTKPQEPPAAPSAGVDLAAFYETLAADETWPALMALDGESLDSFYGGLSAVAVKQCQVYMAMISASGVELALVEVSDSADVQTVKDIFQARVDYQVGTDGNPGGAWYPAPTEMWKNQSRIVSNGNYVMLVAHDNADGTVDAFNALFA